MAHIGSIGASIFTDLAASTGVITSNAAAAVALPSTLDMNITTGFASLFLDETTSIAGSFRRVSNIREFPSIGTPANIVKVPTYQKTLSQQIQGQADSPSLEFQVNYVASDWITGASGTVFGNMVLDGLQRVWRFSLLNVDSLGVTAATKYASLVAGLGTVPNTQYFWLGKLESLQVKTSLTDSSIATLTVSMQSDFYGSFTI